MFSNIFCIIIYYMYNDAKLQYNILKYSRSPFFNHLQILVDSEVFLLKCSIHEIEAVLDLKHGVAVNGVAAIFRLGMLPQLKEYLFGEIF